MFVRALALGAVVAVLAFATGASAAPKWGGYYLGLSAGQGSAENTTSRDIDGTGYFAADSITAIEAASAMTLDEETFIGGAQIGVNWPLGDVFVIGAEVDASGFGNDTSKSATGVYPCCGPTTFTTINNVEQTWLGTARLRLGVASGWFMLYATGGYAGGEVTFTQSFSDTFSPIPLESVENSEWRSGYSVGGGIEMLIESGASIKLEYLHVDLGDIEAAGTIAVPTRTNAARAEVTDEIFRVGINFQMD